jgi:alpha-beta hydrolase superfamily lysophospholipase
MRDSGALKGSFPGAPDGDCPSRGGKEFMRRLFRLIFRTAFILAVIVFTLILVRAFDARRQPDLAVWHTVELTEEYRADRVGDVTTWQDYLALEDRVFDELQAKVIDVSANAEGDFFNRYNPESDSYPPRAGRDWNRSFELPVDAPRGVAVLVHGLTDAPYSMRAIGRILQNEGLHVVAPRMPGHGTIPAGLLRAAWPEWLTIVNLAAAHARQVAGPDAPVFFFGYSNGGALVLKATLDRLESGSATPDGLVLFSPAVGITKFAALASWHRILSRIPYFEKFRWTSVYPEFDPYKYNSFPKEAGHQSWDLSLVVQDQIDQLVEAGRFDAMPPVLTFQSLVDSTVLTKSTVNALYDQLPDNGSELVLYDINRYESVKALIRSRHQTLLDTLIAEDHPYTLTLVTNVSEDDRGAEARRWGPGARPLGTIDLEADWPVGVYSLSHIAIPFPVNDPVYGVDSKEKMGEIVALGLLQPRGERGVLRVPVELFMRLHFNPFFDHLEARILEEVRKPREGS